MADKLPKDMTLGRSSIYEKSDSLYGAWILARNGFSMEVTASTGSLVRKLFPLDSNFKVVRWMFGQCLDGETPLTLENIQHCQESFYRSLSGLNPTQRFLGQAFNADIQKLRLNLGF